MFHLHKWITVKDTGKHRYKECVKCEKRKLVVMYPGGQQPIDRDWLGMNER
jgi:hypothetical protein